MIHGIIGLIILLCAIAAGVLVFVFWLWMLVNAITNTRLSGTEKIVWVLVILFLHVLGALIYFFVGRTKAA